jgi:5-(carboxyamino)imidazole ribonucleotide synthase
MGYRFLTLDPQEDCPGSQVSDAHIISDYDDVESLEELATRSDLLLYEFENINVDAMKQVEDKVWIPQTTELLEMTQNRILEKETLQEIGVKVVPFNIVKTEEDLLTKYSASPSVLKTATGGYDGKGQWILRELEDIHELPSTLFSSERSYILEQWIPLEREFSFVIAKGSDQSYVIYPPSINLHRNHILHMSYASPSIHPELHHIALEVA